VSHCGLAAVLEDGLGYGLKVDRKVGEQRLAEVLRLAASRMDEVQPLVLTQ
jgi:hypothetical protein